MRTVTFKSVLHNVARMAGLDPNSGDLTNELAQQITSYINERLREAWEWTWWPELMLVESRAVDDSDGFFVDYDEASKTPIGETMGVYKQHPFESSSPHPIDFVPSANGLQLKPTPPDDVYVYFRSRPVTFDATVWTATENTAVGDIRYYADTGECYLCLIASAHKNPVTQTTYWEKIDFPYILSSYVRMAAYADYLRADGQMEKAMAVYGAPDNPRPGTAHSALLNAVDIAQSQQAQYWQGRQLTYA